jgi:hypothetical protein
VNGDILTEAIDTSEEPYRDPHDRTGRRCPERHPELGLCHRRFDHTAHDPWHHAMTDAGDTGKTAQYWRWRDR